MDAFLEQQVALPDEEYLSATCEGLDTCQGTLSCTPSETQDASTSGDLDQHVGTNCPQCGQIFSKPWKLRLVANSEIALR